MKHEKEIIRWAKCPDGTKVWYKDIGVGWYSVNIPSWGIDNIYIVDDEYATVRMFHVDNGYAYYRNEKSTMLTFNGKVGDYSTTFKAPLSAKEEELIRLLDNYSIDLFKYRNTRKFQTFKALVDDIMELTKELDNDA